MEVGILLTKQNHVFIFVKLLCIGISEYANQSQFQVGSLCAVEQGLTIGIVIGRSSRFYKLRDPILNQFSAEQGTSATD